MPRQTRTSVMRIGAKYGRLYNTAFRELGFIYPSKKAKASQRQKAAYNHVRREFKLHYKCGSKKGDAVRLWYRTCVRLGYLPTKTQRVAIKRRFREMERVSKDQDIKATRTRRGRA